MKEEDSMKQKVLITGVAGLIGSRMASWILDNHSNIEVIGVDNLSGGCADNIDSRVQFHQLDCADDRFTNLMAIVKPDYVYHFAAYAAEGLSPFIRKYNYQNNLMSTANIVNACINNRVKRLVFTSSMAVYGSSVPPFDETLPRNPIDPYGVAKAACEQDIEIAGKQHGLDWCIIRPHNVYGKNQNIWDKYRNVLGIWMYQHLRGLPLAIYGTGDQTRAFSYIDDCLLPLWKAATDSRASKQIINLGGTKEYSINEAADLLLEVMGGGTKTYMEQRHEVVHAWSTWEKSIQLLDYQETVNLKEGLTKMWNWAKVQPDRGQFKWGEYEISKGIYTYWK
jgi:UDP-glucose 4-epimerase